MKKNEPAFKIGDVVNVSFPTMGINLKFKENETNIGVEEIYLIGDEALIVSSVEFVKRTNEYLYRVLTEATIESLEFDFSEEQLVLATD